MKKATMELSVGGFVLLGIAALVYLAVNLGEMELMGREYYSVNARFSSVSGLVEGARVEIAGVPVGSVASITLDTERMAALVGMRIEKKVELTSDAIASIRTSGLIGDRYVKITPGAGLENLKDGDFITETEPSINFEELISKYVFGEVK